MNPCTVDVLNSCLFSLENPRQLDDIEKKCLDNMYDFYKNDPTSNRYLFSDQNWINRILSLSGFSKTVRQLGKDDYYNAIKADNRNLKIVITFLT